MFYSKFTLLIIDPQLITMQQLKNHLQMVILWRKIQAVH